MKAFGTKFIAIRITLNNFLLCNHIVDIFSNFVFDLNQCCIDLLTSKIIFIIPLRVTLLLPNFLPVLPHLPPLTLLIRTIRKTVDRADTENLTHLSQNNKCREHAVETNDGWLKRTFQLHEIPKKMYT